MYQIQVGTPYSSMMFPVHNKEDAYKMYQHMREAVKLAAVKNFYVTMTDMSTGELLGDSLDND